MRPLSSSVRAALTAASVTGVALVLAVSGHGLLAQAQQAPAQVSGASHDVFTFVRALDEAASRNVWPGFDPSGLPLALFDGERTVLLRHPNPPPEFTPWLGHPGALIVNGRHPAVIGNSTRDIGGVRTATVVAAPGQPIERILLATVEEVFHVFWLARHPAFRPNELARYAYPLDDEGNLARLLAEDEALARAIEATSVGEAARWAAAALALRRARTPALAADVRGFETALEMMEGTANYVARVAAGEPPDRTAARLRAHRTPEDIRWRFYDSGAALCLLLDRFSPRWQERSDREPTLTIVEMMGEALGGRDLKPAAFSEAEAAGFQSRAAGDVDALRGRRQRLRAELSERRGGRIVIDVDAGAEAFRVTRFDPINLTVLDGGAIVHANYLALSVPQGTVDLTNPAFVRASSAARSASRKQPAVTR